MKKPPKNNNKFQISVIIISSFLLIIIINPTLSSTPSSQGCKNIFTAGLSMYKKSEKMVSETPIEFENGWLRSRCFEEWSKNKSCCKLKEFRNYYGRKYRKNQHDTRYTLFRIANLFQINRKEFKLAKKKYHSEIRINNEDHNKITLKSEERGSNEKWERKDIKNHWKRVVLSESIEDAIELIKNDFTNFYLTFRLFSQRCYYYISEFSKNAGCRFCSGNPDRYIEHKNRVAVNPDDCRWTVHYCARHWLTTQFLKKVIKAEYLKDTDKNEKNYQNSLLCLENLSKKFSKNPKMIDNLMYVALMG